MARFFIDQNFTGVEPESLASLVSTTFQSIEDDHNAGPDLISVTDVNQTLPVGITRGDVVIKLDRDELFIGIYNGIQVVYASIGTFSGAITDAQHGTRAGGNLHPDATTTVAGFHSAADKIKSDHYLGDTSSALPATTTQYPNNGDWGYHTDTNLGLYHLAKNKSGTIYSTLLA